MENNISTGKWLLYIIVANLPIINVISLLFWGFAKSTNPNLKTWARAQMIIAIIQTVFCIFIALKGLPLMGTM